MKNKIIISIFILVAVFAFFILILLNRGEEIERLSPEEVAKNWIEANSSTYLFDGFDLNLESLNILDCPDCFEVIYSFSSRSAGYGDRTDELSAQVITPHIIRVVVIDGVVVDAITDEIFSEFENKFINDTLESVNVFIYFGKINEEELFSVRREIPYTESIEKDTLKELLDGPTAEEINMGYFTSINSNVVIEDFEINDQIAMIDFNSELEREVAGSARVMAIYAQIEKTLKQFETISEVIISINGRTEDILQP